MKTYFFPVGRNSPSIKMWPECNDSSKEERIKREIVSSEWKKLTDTAIMK